MGIRNVGVRILRFVGYVAGALFVAGIIAAFIWPEFEEGIVAAILLPFRIYIFIAIMGGLFLGFCSEAREAIAQKKKRLIWIPGAVFAVALMARGLIGQMGILLFIVWLSVITGFFLVLREEIEGCAGKVAIWFRALWKLFLSRAKEGRS